MTLEERLAATFASAKRRGRAGALVDLVLEELESDVILVLAAKCPDTFSVFDYRETVRKEDSK